MLYVIKYWLESLCFCRKSSLSLITFYYKSSLPFIKIKVSLKVSLLLTEIKLELCVTLSISKLINFDFSKLPENIYILSPLLFKSSRILKLLDSGFKDKKWCPDVSLCKFLSVSFENYSYFYDKIISVTSSYPN